MDDGWGDDDLDLDIIDDSQVISPHEITSRDLSSSVANWMAETNIGPVEDGDAWDDDNLDFDSVNDDHVDCVHDTQETKVSSGTIRTDNLSTIELECLNSLRDYIQSLPGVVSSLRAVCEAEYNTFDHAMRLREYYESRPQLRDYTVATELPRMDYVVVTDGNSEMRHKEDVADFIMSKPNTILFRCANQSLLADVISLLSGPDRVIQMRFLASAIASKCEFKLFDSHVHCECSICLSLPGVSGERLDVAHLNVSIDFHPDVPHVHYQLNNVVTFGDADETTWLVDSAIFLASMSVHDEDDDRRESPSWNADAFRDSLLQHVSKTHQFVQSGQTGLNSAWKQLDSAANVTQKIDFVKRVGGGLLPSLPSTELVVSASDYLGDEPSLEYNPSKNHRPAPILGGFLMSGLTRLAKSVAIPPAEGSDRKIVSSQIAHVPSSHEKMLRNDCIGRTNNVEPWERKGSAAHEARHCKEELPCSDVVNHENSEISEKYAGSSNLVSFQSRKDPNESECPMDGWADDDFSLDDAAHDEETFGSTPDNSFLQRTSPPSSTIGGYTVGEESQVIEEAETIVTDEYGKSPVVLPSIPSFQYDADNDIIPSRKRWIHPRSRAFLTSKS